MPRVREALLAGALWGLGVMTRGTLVALPLALPFGIALSAAHRRLSNLRWIVPTALAGLAVLAPWMIRNNQVIGVPVVSSTWSWAPMYAGSTVADQITQWRDLTALDNGAIALIGSTALEVNPRTGTPMDEVRDNKVARDVTLAAWAADPAGFVRRAALGTVFVWFFTFDTGMRGVSLAVHATVFVFLVAGAVILFRRYRDAFWRAWPALCLIVFVNLFYAIAYPHVRYMAPAIVLSLVFAAVSLQLLLQGVLQRVRARAPVSGALPVK